MHKLLTFDRLVYSKELLWFVSYILFTIVEKFNLTSIFVNALHFNPLIHFLLAEQGQNASALWFHICPRTSIRFSIYYFSGSFINFYRKYILTELVFLGWGFETKRKCIKINMKIESSQFNQYQTTVLIRIMVPYLYQYSFTNTF